MGGIIRRVEKNGKWYEGPLADDYCFYYTGKLRVIVHLSKSEQEQSYFREDERCFLDDLEDKYGKCETFLYTHEVPNADAEVEVIENLDKEPPNRYVATLDGEEANYLLLLGDEEVFCKKLTDYEKVLFSKEEYSYDWLPRFVEETYGIEFDGYIYNSMFVKKPPVFAIWDDKHKTVCKPNICGVVEDYYPKGDKAPDWLEIYAEGKTTRIRMTERMKDQYENIYRAKNMHYHSFNMESPNYPDCYEYDGEIYLESVLISVTNFYYGRNSTNMSVRY